MLPQHLGASSPIRKGLTKISLVFLSILLLVGASGGAAQAEPLLHTRSQPRVVESNLEYVPNEVLVKFKASTAVAEIERINEQCGTRVSCSTPWGVKRLYLHEGMSVWEIVARYRQSPHVEYAEPNYIARASFVPNDPLYQRYQWHLKRMNMEQAWDLSAGRGVVVAVLDTGVAYEDYGDYRRAPDLALTSFVAGYDFANGDSHPNDDEGHGTHIAGIIAQSTNNGLGTAGVAFNCRIMPIKVLDDEGSGTHADIAAGIRYAVDHGAQVINLSLAGTKPSSTLEESVAYAYERGVTVVAATGNRGAGTVDYPAAYDEYVIAVGATGYDDRLASYSNYGESMDVVAPGGTRTDGNKDGYPDGVVQESFEGDPQSFGYYLLQGTSMAAAHVSGICALLIARGISGPDRVRQTLQSTARDLDQPGWDSKYGWGIVDAYAALKGRSAAKLPTSNTGQKESPVSVSSSSADAKAQAEESPEIITPPSKPQLEVNLTKSRFSPIFSGGKAALLIKVKAGRMAGAGAEVEVHLIDPEGEVVKIWRGKTNLGGQLSFPLEGFAAAGSYEVAVAAEKDGYASGSASTIIKVKGFPERP